MVNRRPFACDALHVAPGHTTSIAVSLAVAGMDITCDLPSELYAIVPSSL
jgi:hypothetical protein